MSNPSVFFVLFIWVMATIVSVKINDTRPFKWVLILTISLIIFRVLPMSNHPASMTQEQIVQLTTQLARGGTAGFEADLPPVITASPMPVAKAIPLARGGTGVAATLPPVVTASPIPVAKAIPVARPVANETPSAQLITN